MKQYTSNDQTSKLIELGFEKPKGSVECELPKGDWRIGAIGIRKAYSIGELLEMLPKEINSDTLPGMFGIYIDHNKMWAVDYSSVLGEQYSTNSIELIDAIYDMIIKLKKDGVI